MMEAGRYVPAADDLVMPDVAYEDFRFFMDLVRGV
jgi:hypothetical protein